MWIYSPVSQIDDSVRAPKKKQDRPSRTRENQLTLGYHLQNKSANNKFFCFVFFSEMSNNTKKKQEEKHLKILREFLSLSTNKTCFDCNQRGPTYVNTTIGSFVCISCSGKL